MEQDMSAIKKRASNFSSLEKERKNAAEEKKDILLTGGGPSTSQKTDDDLIRSIVNEKTIDGMVNDFDGDQMEIIEDINENAPPTLEDTPSTSQWKNYTPSEMQRPPHKALSTSRRRPITVVKALTSSNIAERYNQLLDKRLSIADLTENEMKQKKEFKEQSRAIKLQLLQIELEIKQKQLENLEKNNYL
ncbi:hypothetical protein RN001_005863 [Aquatica leii]|uniref:Uncharacterized protein n=1 Tax=Aquatica leii TaxID=1421715 RepID=A0AAN7Q101_9COLE|nr:hypothetical protein RN001_005863 [Aquatica leii]